MPSAPRSPTPSSPLAGRRVLLGVSGGVAAYKVVTVARQLVAAGADVQVVMTASAERFVGPDTFAALTGNPVHTSLWDEPGTVLHVDLAHEADVALVAPATAQLDREARARTRRRPAVAALLEADCPLVIAPAMHTGMWQHPATRGNVATLEERGVRFVGPVAGPLAHGDEGVGRLAEPEDIVAAVEAAVGKGGDLAGHRVIVTAGPTHEPLDPVRFIGNRSSGKMGLALAAEAAARGAEVALDPGARHRRSAARRRTPSTSRRPRRCARPSCASPDRRTRSSWPPPSPTSAPRPRRPTSSRRARARRELALVPTPDILRELGERRGRRGAGGVRRRDRPTSRPRGGASWRRRAST